MDVITQLLTMTSFAIAWRFFMITVRREFWILCPGMGQSHPAQTNLEYPLTVLRSTRPVQSIARGADFLGSIQPGMDCVRR